MLETMSVKQFRRWVEYAQLEPFGEERDDWRAGLVTSAVYNVNIDPRKHRQLDPIDFMPKFANTDTDETDEDQDQDQDDVYDDFEADDEDESNQMTQSRWSQLKREIMIASGAAPPNISEI